MLVIDGSNWEMQDHQRRSLSLEQDMAHDTSVKSGNVAVQPRGREVERKQDGKAPSRVAPATRRLEAFFRLRFAQPIWQPRLRPTNLPEIVLRHCILPILLGHNRVLPSRHSVAIQIGCLALAVLHVQKDR